jgi:hypothetical protein
MEKSAAAVTIDVKPQSTVTAQSKIYFQKLAHFSTTKITTQEPRKSPRFTINSPRSARQKPQPNRPILKHLRYKPSLQPPPQIF